VLYVTRAGTDNKPDGGDEGGSGGGILEFINNYIPNFPGLPSIPNIPFIPGSGVSSEANSTDEKPTEKPSTDKAEKVRAPRFIGYTEINYKIGKAVPVTGREGP
jgi:hypothetical protein